MSWGHHRPAIPGLSGRTLESNATAFDELNEERNVMSRTNPSGKGVLYKLRPSRGFSIVAVIALLATFLVPVGVSAAGPAQTITISPSSGHAAQGSTETWTATVTDSSNNPVSGIALLYFVSGSNTIAVTPISGVTNSSGQLTFSYTGTNAGTDTITVFKDNDSSNTLTSGDISGTATVYWSSPQYLTLNPAISTRSIGTPATMTATVLDSSLAGLAGVSVSYIITGANPSSGTVTTGANGSATFNDSGIISGNDTIQVTSGLLTPATSSIQWIQGGGVLLLNASNATPTLNTTESISLTLEDGNFTPIANVPVYFNVTGANFRSGSATTDISGNATFNYSSSVAGQDTITAYADFDRSGTKTAGEPSNTTTVTWGGTSNGNGTSLTLSPSSQNATPGNSASLGVALTNINGSVYGVPIHYSVTGANPMTGTATTNLYGNTSFSYVGNYAGTDTITAYADLNNNGYQDSGEPSSTATVIWGNGSAIGLTLSPTSQNAAPGSQASVTAHFTDPYASINGASVRYTITGANGGSGSVLTDANGNATISYTGTNVGTDTISAYVDLNTNGYQDNGEPSATATVTRTGSNLSLAPATQSVAPGTQVSLTGTYFNQNGSPTGAIVRYTVSGANQESGSLNADSNGQVTITYTGANAGTDTVSAYVDLNNNGAQDSGEPSATATVSWNGTAAISLAPLNQNPTLGTSATVTATVTSTNISVAGVTVRYIISGVNGRAGSVQTDNNGLATITYTGTNAGTDYVWAYADLNNDGALDAGETSSTVTISWATSGTTTPTPPTQTVPDAAQPATAKAGCTYFVATQHNICAGFQSYWNKFGGLAIFGMPITEEFQENGITVQYFERARFEWHPGSAPQQYDVLLGLVGNEVTAGRQAEAPFLAATPKTSADCTYYAATGHNLCAGFQAYWEQNGGLAIFGYPISEEFQEKNPDTGQVYTVQYFQRGRFEWHPGESPSTFDVELGRLGAQDFSMKYGVAYH